MTEVSINPCARCGVRHPLPRTIQSKSPQRYRVILAGRWPNRAAPRDSVDRVGQVGTLIEWAQYGTAPTSSMWMRLEFAEFDGNDCRRENFDPCQLQLVLEAQAAAGDPRHDWLVCVRLADLLLKGHAWLQASASGTEVNHPSLVRHTLTFMLTSTHPIDARITSDDEHQLCEETALHWMERAKQFAASPTGSPAGRQIKCDTCLAEVGEACHPVHAGERDPGLWVHPARRQAVLFFKEASDRFFNTVEEAHAAIAAGDFATLTGYSIIQFPPTDSPAGQIRYRIVRTP